MAARRIEHSMISAFDLFKIGIGPSSSHTVGPMIAAGMFRNELAVATVSPARITVELFGSLAWTGHGHGSDIAICLGLLGETPSTVEPDAVAGLIAGLRGYGTCRYGPASRRKRPSTPSTTWYSTGTRCCPATPTGCGSAPSTMPAR